jgi:hypothetical protein
MLFTKSFKLFIIYELGSLLMFLFIAVELLHNSLIVKYFIIINNFINST